MRSGGGPGARLGGWGGSWLGCPSPWDTRKPRWGCVHGCISQAGQCGPASVDARHRGSRESAPHPTFRASKTPTPGTSPKFCPLCRFTLLEHSISQASRVGGGRHAALHAWCWGRQEPQKARAGKSLHDGHAHPGPCPQMGIQKPGVVPWGPCGTGHASLLWHGQLSRPFQKPEAGCEPEAGRAGNTPPCPGLLSPPRCSLTSERPLGIRRPTGQVAPCAGGTLELRGRGTTLAQENGRELPEPAEGVCLESIPRSAQAHAAPHPAPALQQPNGSSPALVSQQLPTPSLDCNFLPPSVAPAAPHQCPPGRAGRDPGDTEFQLRSSRLRGVSAWAVVCTLASRAAPRAPPGL